MKNYMRNKNLLALSVSAALLTSQSFSTLAAQEAEVERIEVTGSHIKRQDMEGPSPVTSLSAADIGKTGVTDLIGLFAKVMIQPTVVQASHYVA